MQLFTTDTLDVLHIAGNHTVLSNITIIWVLADCG